MFKSGKSYILLLLCFLAYFRIFSQETYPVNGAKDPRDRYYILKNANIYMTPDSLISGATLTIKDGRIVSVSAQNSKFPTDAVVIDAAGKWIYPAFVDIFSSYGSPEPKAEGDSPKLYPQMLSNKKGAYSWNESLKSEFEAYAAFTSNNTEAEALRKLGFGSVVSHRPDGISRGSGALVNLSDQKENLSLIKDRVAHYLSFSKGTSTQAYPSSLAGVVSLLRQTYLDGKWYAETGKKEERNISLQAWNDLQSLPQIIEVYDKLDILKAVKIGKEFGIQYIIKGVGDEYQRMDEIKAAQVPLILTLNFPKAIDIKDMYEAEDIGLSELKHWELAPYNPAYLAGKNITFAISLYGMKDKSEFWQNLRLAIKNGLPKATALKALTIIPAQLTKTDDLVGSIKAGKLANFIVTSGDIFEKEEIIYQTWVDGTPYNVNNPDKTVRPGLYHIVTPKDTFKINVLTELGKTKIKLDAKDSSKTVIDIDKTFTNVNIRIKKANNEVLLLNGIEKDSVWSGAGNTLDGVRFNWYAIRAGEAADTDTVSKKNNADSLQPGKIWYPFTAYGWEQAPEPKKYLIKNANIWTNTSQGRITGDVLIENGKITKIGSKIDAAGAEVIDAGGKDLTPGIIDEHSHIALTRGVNEGTQSSSAEVRMEDALYSEDINIFRQLSGGVTTSQLLHGSANAIGGQSAIVKLRWGQSPTGLKFQGADPFIKFALGENVKQSNWGDQSVIRFPQTRMGVEQVYEDMFTQAEKYRDLKKSGKPYRRDLDVEAILEIVEGKRFITCHSYVQSEINMLMKVAERHNFRINTFTHILEGYKVADKMKKHGAGGSTFGDWWDYKFEVYDAIPYNAYLMYRAGVVTAINSDDAEMARRLNQEAGKSVMYAGMDEQEALKMVTLNPAKLLHLDKQVGSIAVGKDADLVVWSANPLSVYAKAEKTFIDGILYFDRSRLESLNKRNYDEKMRLVNKMINAKNNGAPTEPRTRRRPPRLYHCDDIDNEVSMEQTGLNE